MPKPAVPGWGFQKFTKRGIDWAIVGVVVQGRSVGLVNMGPAPLPLPRREPPRWPRRGRAGATEEALAGGAGPRDAAALAADGTSPPG